MPKMDRQRSLSPDSRIVVEGLMNLELVQRSPRTNSIAETLITLAHDALAPINENEFQQEFDISDIEHHDEEPVPEAIVEEGNKDPPKKKRKKRTLKGRATKHGRKAKKRRQHNYRKFPVKPRADEEEEDQHAPDLFDMEPAEPPQDPNDEESDDEPPPILPEKGNVDLHFLFSICRAIVAKSSESRIGRQHHAIFSQKSNF